MCVPKIYLNKSGFSEALSIVPLLLKSSENPVAPHL